MKFHPLTQIIVAAELALLTIILPVYVGITVLMHWLFLVLTIPSRTETKITGVFLKILMVAAFFLFLIHGVEWRSLRVSIYGIFTGLNNFVHIAAPVIFVIYLSRQVKSEEIFSLLIDIRVPPVVILILFRTVWLVPRFVERIDEVITAQKLRGMRIETVAQRIRALLPTLSPIFSSMLEEISENSLTLTTRGFLQPGQKSHLAVLRYRWIDWILIVVVTLLVILLWLVFL